MTIEELIDAAKVNQRLSVSMGELVPSEDGFLTASFSLGQNVVYVDGLRRTSAVVTPKNEYRARSYRLKKNDCVTLVLEWLARERGVTHMPDGKKTLMEMYSTIDNRSFMSAYKDGAGMMAGDFGFSQVDKEDLQVGDVIAIHNHVAVVVAEGKMLHHLPSKLSSVDDINFALVTEVYRYAN